MAPPGETTRPTADRLRQALFDMLWHAPWCGRTGLDGALVLDAFAGTGALGLEALSRGAALATFMECHPAALTALRSNIAACNAKSRATILATDVSRPPPGSGCAMAFLDPPYGQALVPAAIASLDRAGWLAPNALLIAESERGEPLDLSCEKLAERAHGAGRITVWRHAG